MYNPKLIDVANNVYSLEMDGSNCLTKSIMQYELRTSIKAIWLAKW